MNDEMEYADHCAEQEAQSEDEASYHEGMEKEAEENLSLLKKKLLEILHGKPFRNALFEEWNVSHKKSPDDIFLSDTCKPFPFTLGRVMAALEKVKKEGESFLFRSDIIFSQNHVQYGADWTLCTGWKPTNPDFSDATLDDQEPRTISALLEIMKDFSPKK